ncbi:MAG TPA: spondin domain-containing protein, partial [Blastocatellia bacterium]
MRKRQFLFLIIPVMAVLIVLPSGFFRTSAMAERPRYEVTITNLMRAQQLTPAVVATHSGNLKPVFTLGQPIRTDLIPLVEDADTGPFSASLSADPNVLSVQVIGQLIFPGQSASTEIEFDGNHNRLTIVSMLATTQDGFIALNGEAAPSTGVVTYFSPVYDAGSEYNSEDCTFTPGPRCQNFFVHDPRPS